MSNAFMDSLTPVNDHLYWSKISSNLNTFTYLFQSVYSTGDLETKQTSLAYLHQRGFEVRGLYRFKLDFLRRQIDRRWSNNQTIILHFGSTSMSTRDGNIFLLPSGNSGCGEGVGHRLVPD
jgi:hypothetical protein